MPKPDFRLNNRDFYLFSLASITIFVSGERTTLYVVRRTKEKALPLFISRHSRRPCYNCPNETFHFQDDCRSLIFHPAECASCPGENNTLHGIKLKLKRNTETEIIILMK